MIAKKWNRRSTTSSRTVPSGDNRDTSYGRRMSQPSTSYGEQWKTSATPPNSWQHVNLGSKHGWSIAEEGRMKLFCMSDFLSLSLCVCLHLSVCKSVSVSDSVSCLYLSACRSLSVCWSVCLFYLPQSLSFSLSVCYVVKVIENMITFVSYSCWLLRCQHTLNCSDLAPLLDRLDASKDDMK